MSDIKYEDTTPTDEQGQPVESAQTSELTYDQVTPTDEQGAPLEQPQPVQSAPEKPTGEFGQDFGEIASAGLSGLESAIPGSAWVKTHLDPMITGESPEAIKERLNKQEEEHPVATGVGKAIGDVGLIMAGEGALGIGSKIGTLPKWSKLGANVIKGAIEGAALQGNDEINKSIMGKGDPNAAVSSALTNMGTTGLIGGGIEGTLGLGGIVLRSAADSAAMRGVKKFMADFAKQSHIEQANPDMVDALTNELKDFHESTAAVGDEARGSSGLKSQAIDKLSQNIKPEQIDSHIHKVSDIIDKMPEDMHSYKPFQEALQNWQDAILPRTDASGQVIQATPGQVFKATEQLKRQMQEWGQYNKTLVPLAEQPFRNAAKAAGHDLRESLENTGDWGDLGLLQKKYNKATSEYFEPLKAFNSQFTRKIEGDPTVDLGKVSTYIKQNGKDTGEFKNGVLNRYVSAAEKYRDQLEELHNQLGLDSPFEESPLTLTKNMMGKPTAGAKAAMSMYRGGIGNLAAKGAASFAGMTLGHLSGLPGGEIVGGLGAQALAKHLTPVMEAAIAKPIKKYGIPMALRVAGENAPEAMGEAMRYADKVNKGSYLIKNSLNKLINPVSEQMIYNDQASESEKNKLKKFIEQGGMNAQMQNQINQMNTDQTTAQKPNGFAQGGEVVDQSSGKQQPSPSDLSAVLPDHAAALQQARARVYTYLNGIRPESAPQQLPFDSKPDNTMANKKYDRALNMAIHPLNILNKVKTGNVNLEDMQHFTSMYPELHEHLSKEMTKRVSDAQMKGIKPSYTTQQGMSMFMGAPLNSTFTPQAIMSIQATYAPPASMSAAQGGAKGKTRKGTSTLGKSNSSYMTSSQNAEKDRAERE